MRTFISTGTIFGANATRGNALKGQFTLTALANIEFQYAGGSWVQRIIFDLNGTNKAMFEITMTTISYAVTDDGGVTWQILWTK